MNYPLSVQNLSKSYRKVRAVINVNFEIDEGEIFALVGPNGAGKSTILRIISTILSYDSGSVSIYGLDLKNEQSKIRELISYLPEEAGAYRNLTGNGYLKFMAGIYTDDALKQKEYVELGRNLCGLNERLKSKVKTYSKGMTRKLLLARAMMNKPRLAILDEPTSGLDVTNGFEIRKIIKKMAEDGMAVLLSSHNMLEIEYLSDRVALIDKGEIKACDTPDRLKQDYRVDNLETLFVKLSS